MFGSLKIVKSCKTFLESVRKMSVFVQKLNILTGATEWHVEDENYDFHQEIARSAFADMLHDTDRNKKYFAALKIAIKEKHAAGEEAHVLDIGTGTGLLSMMAAVSGADTIVACECFRPIASIARDVISENGLKDKIKVVCKRSTDLVVGKDMDRRANILVTEVFDTELIGEGAIETFNHAKEHLLETDAIVIPSTAWMYALVVESEFLRDHYTFDAQAMAERGLKIPGEILTCLGSAGLHDLQVSELPPSSFKVLTKPVEVFRFDFRRGGIEKKRRSEEALEVVAEGRADCVVIWWELGMLGGGPFISCAPSWAPPGGRGAPAWRDHWMQAVYRLPGAPPLRPDSRPPTLVSHHDQFSHWFNLQTDPSSESSGVDDSSVPVCSCGFHATCPRPRMASLNSGAVWERQLNLLKQVVQPSSVVLFVGDTSLLPLKIAQMGVKKVYCCDDNIMSFRNLRNIIKENNLESKITLLNEYDPAVVKDVDIVLSEPYFRAALLPWDNLRCWYLRAEVAPGAARVCPSSASVWAAAVEFDHLHKIRAPLGVVEGFDMTSFDKLIKSSSDISDEKVEPHPLWEYPGRALSRAKRLMSFDLHEGIPERLRTESGRIEFKSQGVCNGIALWMDWHFGDVCVNSGGPTKEIVAGERVEWDLFSKQAVYLLPEAMKEVVPGQTWLTYNVTFEPSEATTAFHFELL